MFTRATQLCTLTQQVARSISPPIPQMRHQTCLHPCSQRCRNGLAVIGSIVCLVSHADFQVSRGRVAQLSGACARFSFFCQRRFGGKAPVQHDVQHDVKDVSPATGTATRDGEIAGGADRILVSAPLLRWRRNRSMKTEAGWGQWRALALPGTVDLFPPVNAVLVRNSKLGKFKLPTTTKRSV